MITFIYFDMYSESCIDVKTAIRNSKSEILQKKISDCNGDQKKLFKIVDTLLGRNKHTTLPKYDSPLTMASVMNNFFIDKIDNIRAEFPLLEANLPCYSFLSMDSIMPICTTTLYHFDRVTDPELLKIISGMNNTTCSSDPFPTRLLMSHLHAIVPILQHIVNLCLTTGDFPISCKSSIVIPLIKKPGLDREMLKNYRPASNLSFLSKVIEKVISIRILGHILDNNIVDRFQSAYRAGHSCETALLRVYNDIVTTVGKGNGSFLVLDLSAAFDTIDHDNLFYILEKYVGIGGSALRLIRSYEYLCDLIRLNVKSTTIRTRASFDPCLLCVPPISKTCANSFFDRSFVYAAPTLWNALDLDIRLLPFDAFKKRVKTHLYLKYFAN